MCHHNRPACYSCGRRGRCHKRSCATRSNHILPIAAALLTKHSHHAAPALQGPPNQAYPNQPFHENVYGTRDIRGDAPAYHEGKPPAYEIVAGSGVQMAGSGRTGLLGMIWRRHNDANAPTDAGHKTAMEEAYEAGRRDARGEKA